MLTAQDHPSARCGERWAVDDEGHETPAASPPVTSVAPDKPASNAFTSIVESIRQRRPESMEQLYVTFGKGIRCMFARQLGPHEADDGVQQTMMDAITAIQRNGLEHPERLAGFISTIARRRVAAGIRARIRERSTECSMDVYAIAAPDGAAPRAEHTFFGRQVRTIAGHVLASMKPKQREVLVRFYVTTKPNRPSAVH